MYDITNTDFHKQWWHGFHNQLQSENIKHTTQIKAATQKIQFQHIPITYIKGPTYKRIVRKTVIIFAASTSMQPYHSL